MVTVVAQGYAGAQGVFDLNPEYPVTQRRIRRGLMTPIGGGSSRRRQVALSAGEIDFESEVREWTLNWSNALKIEADALSQLYDTAGGRAGFVLYYPPEEAANSNLCTSPENFRSNSWVRGTTDTTVNTDATTLPSGVGGSAYLLENAGGAADEAYIRARCGRFPSGPTLTAFSVFIQRPSSNPSSWFTIKLVNAGTSSGVDIDEHFATYAWGGSAWAFSTGSGDMSTVNSASGAWLRIGIVGFGSDTSVFPAVRFLQLESGTSANPEAGKDLLLAGGQLEEAKAVTGLTGFGSYNPSRVHIRTRIMDDPLVIERWGPNQYRMSVTLREEPSAP